MKDRYTVGFLNAGRGLSHPAKHEQIAEGLQRMNADVVVVGESFDKTGLPYDEAFAIKLGYERFTTEYNDQDLHPSGEQYITMLHRIEGVAPTVLRLATRNAVEITMPFNNGKNVRYIGSHFDDRSSIRRGVMARALRNSLDLPPFSTRPRATPDAVALGCDGNDMHPEDRLARIARSSPAKMAARLIPHARARSLATRFTGMAEGSGLQELTHDKRLVDVDPKHQPTMLLGGFAIAQLDRIMTTPGDLKVSDFTVHPPMGSDHLGISAVIHF